MSGHWDCENGCERPEVIVTVTGEGADETRAIIIDADGEPTNRYADGTIGVPDSLKDAAADEAEGTCAICGTGYACWHHD